MFNGFVSRYLLALFCIGMTACAQMDDAISKYDLNKQSVQSFEITTQKLRSDTAFAALTSTFIERGFDVKTSNKDGGVVTTEYKKFASFGQSPPFDFYLQIRATVREVPGGKTVIRLSPLVKEQNRTNAAAFTERELYYYEGQPEAMRSAERKQSWVGDGQTAFMNIVADLSTKSGVPLEAAQRNVTTTRFNTLRGK
jgi:hypothetical protein